MAQNQLTALVSVVATVLMSPTVAADTLRCVADQKMQCEAGAGCQPIEPSVWVEIDTDQQTYARCDTSGCDTYSATFSVSGAFVIFEIPGHGTFAKVNAASGAFVEIATIETAALVSHGSCR